MNVNTNDKASESVDRHILSESCTKLNEFDSEQNKPNSPDSTKRTQRPI